MALTRLGATFDLYQRAMASAERALDLLDLRPSQSSELNAITVPVRGEIEFKGIHFGYPDRPLLFKNFNLQLAARHNHGTRRSYGQRQNHDYAFVDGLLRA